MNRADGPIVGLLLESRPETLTIVRGMLSGVAELLEMDPELLDDLKTSTSEACNNVVLHAYGSGAGPMQIRIYADEDELQVAVGDEGIGFAVSDGDTDAAAGIGVSVIRTLAREAHFEDRPGGGTQVTMAFDARREGRRLFTSPGAAGAELPLEPVGDDEIEVTLSPVSLLSAVLGRLARTLAADAHFSLDRFSDVYLVTDTLAAHAARAATSDRVRARITAGERRLRIELGPFRPGTGAALIAGPGTDLMSSPLALLADEISVRERDGSEAVDVVVVDHRR